MKIEKEGDAYRASHIPGPSHNYLWLRLSTAPTGRFPIEIRAPIGGCNHDRLTAEDVRPWIEKGLAMANAELGTNFSAAYAAIVENDSRRPNVYISMARAVALAAGSET